MVLLGQAQLMSQFLVKVFAILGLTWLNLVYFKVDQSVIFTRLILTKVQFMLTKEWSPLTKEQLMQTMSL